MKKDNNRFILDFMINSSDRSSRPRFPAILSAARHYRAAGLLALCIVLAPLFHQPASAATGLVLAIHPYLSTDELLQRYSPLARYLGEQMGRDVQVRVGRNYAEHQSHIGKDLVDIAFLGPAIYVNMVQNYGKKPLLARLEVGGKPSFRGAIVTTEYSGIDSLEQLRGRRFAFGDPGSTMSHLVPRYMLQKAGVDLADLRDYRHLGSHVNVALGVLSGNYDAGAVKEEVFEHFRNQGLRVVARSPALSEHLFVTRTDLDPELVRRLRRALLELKHSPRGQHILSSLKPSVSAMVPVSDSDYDNLRDILSSMAEDGS